MITETIIPASIKEWIASLPRRNGWGAWDGVSGNLWEGVQNWSEGFDQDGNSIGIWGMIHHEDSHGDPLDDPVLEYSIYFGDCRDPRETGYKTAEAAMLDAEFAFPECFRNE